MLIDAVEVQCPNCWQMIELVVDCSIPEQSYIEDCSRCCSPMTVQVSVESGIPSVEVRHEND